MGSPIYPLGTPEPIDDTVIDKLIEYGTKPDFPCAKCACRDAECRFDEWGTPCVYCNKGNQKGSCTFKMDPKARLKARGALSRFVSFGPECA